jgi:hypothetical protein
MRKRYIRSKNVKEKRVGNDVALYDKENKAIHVLNGSAWLIWESLQKPLEFEDLLSMMINTFGLDEIELKKDLVETIDIFLKNGLIETVL